MAKAVAIPEEYASAFVPLVKIVAAIAEKIELPPHFDDKATFYNEAFQDAAKCFYEKNIKKIEWQRKISLAARYLNHALHFCVELNPGWLKWDERMGFHVRKPEATKEGVELLTKLGLRGDELSQLCADHIREASSGYRVELINNGLLSEKYFFDNPEDNRGCCYIGFQLREVVNLLSSAGIDFCNSKLSPVLEDWNTSQSSAQDSAELRQGASTGTEAGSVGADEAAGASVRAPKGISKKVMLERHKARWPQIEADIKGAATNGLSAAAKAGLRGWREADALAWAKANGRLLEAPEQGTIDSVMKNGFTSRRHMLR